LVSLLLFGVLQLPHAKMKAMEIDDLKPKPSSNRPSAALQPDTPGERLAKAREELGLTQKQMADSLLVSHAAICDWETGKTPLTRKNAAAIERCFRISAAYLTMNDNCMSAGEKWEFSPDAPYGDTSRDQATGLLDSALPKKRMSQLAKETSEAPYQWSGLIINLNEKLLEIVAEKCKKHGREKDLIVLHPGEKVSYPLRPWNPLHCPYEAPGETAGRLAEAMLLNSERPKAVKGSQAADYEETMRGLFQDCAELIEKEGKWLTLESLALTACSPKPLETVPQLPNRARSKEEGEEACNSGRSLSPPVEDRIGGHNECPFIDSARSVAKAFLSLAQRPEIMGFLSPKQEIYLPPAKPGAKGPFYGFALDKILDEGKIVLLYMPKDKYLGMAGVAAEMLKKQWKDAVLRRKAESELFEDGIEGPCLPRFEDGYAPTFLLTDEFYDALTTEERYFNAQAESKKAQVFYLSTHEGITVPAKFF
jgi:transcriptional regulator with XRE-family HTH domain